MIKKVVKELTDEAASKRQSKKRKRIIIIIASLLFCLILGIVGFFLLQLQLVTGNKKDLQQIVIVERYPGEGGGREGEPKSITTITDQKTMNTIYDELRHAFPIIETRGESFYTMVTPRYELNIHYSDKVDVVSVFFAGASRYLGRPDWFTVSRTKVERITETLESIIDDSQ